MDLSARARRRSAVTHSAVTHSAVSRSTVSRSTVTRGSLLALALAVSLPELVPGQQETGAAARAEDSVAVRKPDVHFVPTAPEVVRAMLGAARVRSGDVVYDLGCGDGRIVIAAVRKPGTRGVCVDIDPVRIAESRHNADTAGVASRIEFRQTDLFQTDLSQANVITLYLLPILNVRLRPKLFREVRPGTRIVSNSFDMGDWKPDSVMEVKTGLGFNSFAYYWVLPADVAGTWEVTLGGSGSGPRYRLQLDQRYQVVTGRATAAGDPVPLRDVALAGRRLGFTLGRTGAGGRGPLRFTGQVTGNRVVGSVAGGRPGTPRSWSATRTTPGPRPELKEEADFH